MDNLFSYNIIIRLNQDIKAICIHIHGFVPEHMATVLKNEWRKPKKNIPFRCIHRRHGFPFFYPIIGRENWLLCCCRPRRRLSTCLANEKWRTFFVIMKAIQIHIHIHTQLQWNLYAKKKIIFFIQILLIYSLMWFSMHFPSWRREARDTAQNNADDMKNIEFECHMRRGGKHSRIIGAAGKCWVCVCVCVFVAPFK